MIANFYADSLFKLSIEEESLEEMIEQFDKFMTAAKDNPDWIILLDTTSIRNKVKMKLLEELNSFNSLFINFLMVIIRNHHITFYEDIYEQWLIITRRHQKIAYVNLYSSKQLTDKRINKIRKDIEDFFPGMEIEFRFQIDPTLIRGIRLTYQGKSIERSLKRTLEDMKLNI